MVMPTQQNDFVTLFGHKILIDLQWKPVMKIDLLVY